MDWIPESVQKEDSVVVLSGGKMPYILRTLREQTVGEGLESGVDSSDDGASKILTFTFVGDAYIHGMMQGEYYDEEKLDTSRLTWIMDISVSVQPLALMHVSGAQPPKSAAGQPHFTSQAGHHHHRTSLRPTIEKPCKYRLRAILTSHCTMPRRRFV